MKKIYQICLIAMIVFTNLSCDKNDKAEPVPQGNIEDCEIEEFYARMLINGVCWTSTFEYFVIEDSTLAIRLRKEEKFEEEFSLRLPLARVHLNDLVFFEGTRTSFFNLWIAEGIDAIVTSFAPKYHLGKELNWIVFDNINSDTTIISGKFETIIYRADPKSNQSIYPSPEKLVITDGKFRIKRI